jgi:ribosomal protein L37AE/L43A
MKKRANHFLIPPTGKHRCADDCPNRGTGECYKCYNKRKWRQRYAKSDQRRLKKTKSAEREIAFGYARERRVVERFERLVASEMVKFGKRIRPSHPCQKCGSTLFQKNPTGVWFCGKCASLKRPSRRAMLPKCAECLFSVGLGITTVAKVTGRSEKVARDLRIKLGVKTPKRRHSKFLHLTPTQRLERKRSNDRTYANTPQRKLKRTLSKRIYSALYGRGKKSARTLELIGCDIQFFKRWIEQQFARGMTWENFGEWHIDHKLPCASFDLTKPEQQRACFHYSNLRPLWKFDNLSKGAKVLNFQPELPIAI